jgi:transcriptional regulator with XRE-family HTH domain
VEIRELIATARRRRSLPDPATRRLIRVTAGVSQAELAAAIGVRGASLSRWETGRRHPRGQVRDRYAHALEELRAVGVGDLHATLREGGP